MLREGYHQADKASGSVEPSRCACEQLAQLPRRGKPLADAVFGGDTSHLIQPAPKQFAGAPSRTGCGHPLNPKRLDLRPHLLQNPMVPGLTIFGKKSFCNFELRCQTHVVSNTKPDVRLNPLTQKSVRLAVFRYMRGNSRKATPKTHAFPGSQI